MILKYKDNLDIILLKVFKYKLDKFIKLIIN